MNLKDLEDILLAGVNHAFIFLHGLSLLWPTLIWPHHEIKSRHDVRVGHRVELGILTNIGHCIQSVGKLTFDAEVRESKCIGKPESALGWEADSLGNSNVGTPVNAYRGGDTPFCMGEMNTLIVNPVRSSLALAEYNADECDA